MANRFAMAFALVVCVPLAAGCSTSIFRTTDLEERSVVTDAKQRLIISVPDRNAPAHNLNTRVYCAEPSPDVAQAISDSLSAALNVEVQGQGGGSAEFARATTESIAQLGERLATIQLLRDGFYRACEAYANGAISDTTYALIISRTDDVMATLLSAELAAGAFGRDLAVIGGDASAGAPGGEADAEQIQTLEQKRTDLAVARVGLLDTLNAEQDPDDLQATRVKLEENRAEDAGLARRIRDLKRAHASAGAAGVLAPSLAGRREHTPRTEPKRSSPFIASSWTTSTGTGSWWGASVHWIGRWAPVARKASWPGPASACLG